MNSEWVYDDRNVLLTIHNKIGKTKREGFRSSPRLLLNKFSRRVPDFGIFSKDLDTVTFGTVFRDLGRLVFQRTLDSEVLLGFGLGFFDLNIGLMSDKNSRDLIVTQEQNFQIFNRKLTCFYLVLFPFKTVILLISKNHSHSGYGLQ